MRTACLCRTRVRLDALSASTCKAKRQARMNCAAPVSRRRGSVITRRRRPEIGGTASRSRFRQEQIHQLGSERLIR